MRATPKNLSLKILLAVDDSPYSAAAVNMLTHISWPAGTSVNLLATVPEQLPLMETRLETLFEVDERVEIKRWRDWAAIQILTTQATAELRAHHLIVETTEICEGQLAEIIPEHAIALSTDLVVIGAKKLSTPNKNWLNSAVYKLASFDRPSVLVVRPSEQIRPLNTILAVDDSSEAWRAVEFVCTLSLPDWAKVTVVSVVEEEEKCLVGAAPAGHYPLAVDAWQTRPGLIEANVVKVARHLQDYGVQVRRLMRFGYPADEILSAAQEQDADLIVVGARSQPMVNAFFWGGVLEKVVNYAPCSVLVVR